MKKKILGGLAIFTFAAITMMNINISVTSNSKKALDVNLENVEAHADLEYIIGAFRCPGHGNACASAYGGNIQWDPYCLWPCG